MNDFFWDASLTELKQGYKEFDDYYICLLCGRVIEKGIVYPYEKAFYEAERFMRVHIEHQHQSVFSKLIKLDKRYTGLTDRQKDLLSLLYEGKSDQEVQEELEIGSASTVRHHRFVLKEKERQAKVLLALSELLNERELYKVAFVPPYKAAQLLENDSSLEEQDRQKTMQAFFPDGTSGRLKEIPSTEKARRIIIEEIAKRLDGSAVYSEIELHGQLTEIYGDSQALISCLIEYELLGCTGDRNQYWLK